MARRIQPVTPAPRLLGIILFAFLLGTFPPALHADNRDATIGLYLVEDQIRRCSGITPRECSEPEVVVTGDLFTGYYAILCVFNGDAGEGVAGVSVGLEYDDAANSGVDIDSWTLCSTLEFPSSTGNGNPEWPYKAGSFNTMTWASGTSCQQEEPGGPGSGVTAIVGYFELQALSSDRLVIIPHPSNGISVVECDPPAETQLTQEEAGWLGFSDDASVAGGIPCLERPVTDATWGTLKDRY